MKCLMRHRDGYVMGTIVPMNVECSLHPNNPHDGYYLTRTRWWHRIQAALRIGFRPMAQLQREEQERDALAS